LAHAIVTVTPSGMQNVNADDYRTSHKDEGYGDEYNKTYETGYYAALWEGVEKPLLESVLRPLSGNGRNCLDFACGTGRITRVNAMFFGRVVGVDVSETMLAAALVPPNAHLKLIDLTAQPLDELFDVVTAFRFFLNAEDSLRRDALKAIRRHLKPGGRLVCNIHMNATSPAGLACRALNLLPGSERRNTMSIRSFRALLSETGFTAEQIIPHGFLPRPGGRLPRLSAAMVEPVDAVARLLRAPARLAQNFIVVAK
jgi:SAM-dependent methyltransferase